MALLAVQDASHGLASVVFSAASAGGDQVPQGTRASGWVFGMALLVSNGDASPHDVTVAGDEPFTVPAGGLAVIPVTGIYNGAPRDVAYDGVTGVTVAAVRVGG